MDRHGRWRLLCTVCCAHGYRQLHGSPTALDGPWRRVFVILDEFHMAQDGATKVYKVVNQMPKRAPVCHGFKLAALSATPITVSLSKSLRSESSLSSLPTSVGVTGSEQPEFSIFQPLDFNFLQPSQSLAKQPHISTTTTPLKHRELRGPCGPRSRKPSLDKAFDESVLSLLLHVVRLINIVNPEAMSKHNGRINCPLLDHVPNFLPVYNVVSA